MSDKNQNTDLKHDNSLINKEILAELGELFEMVPPGNLKKSVCDIFFFYVCNTENRDLNHRFKEIATDFYLLFKFLDGAEIQYIKEEMKETVS